MALRNDKSIKCDKCGLNDAFFDVGGVYTCAPCELRELKTDPIYKKWRSHEDSNPEPTA